MTPAKFLDEPPHTPSLMPGKRPAVRPQNMPDTHCQGWGSTHGEGTPFLFLQYTQTRILLTDSNGKYPKKE